MASEASRPDRRRNAWRDDLAAAQLRGIVAAPRYVAGTAHQVIVAAAPVRRAPQADAPLDTEALHGEIVVVYEVRGDWVWGQLARDRYVGYLPVEGLDRSIQSTTHRVAAVGTFVYPRADIKAPPLSALSLNAEVTVTGIHDSFSAIAGGGFVVTRHIAALDQHAQDFVAVAERLLGTPYLWGGRTRLGVDCSGLVQLALQAAGIDCPRDSDMQAAEVGAPLTIGDDLAGLQRGDLACWPGHIGLMTDAKTLLHANAHHMAVAAEPLAEAVARIGMRPSLYRRMVRESVQGA